SARTADTRQVSGCSRRRPSSPAPTSRRAGSWASTTVGARSRRPSSSTTVVLAQGMVQAERTPEVSALVDFAERFDLRYAEPGMPAEREYTGLPAGETVLV